MGNWRPSCRGRFGSLLPLFNLAGKTPDGCDFAGVGWITEPEGKVLGLTLPDQPFLTLDLDLSKADQAKKTYPRYVLD